MLLPILLPHQEIVTITLPHLGLQQAKRTSYQHLDMTGTRNTLVNTAMRENHNTCNMIFFGLAEFPIRGPSAPEARTLPLSYSASLMLESNIFLFRNTGCHKISVAKIAWGLQILLPLTFCKNMGPHFQRK